MEIKFKRTPSAQQLKFINATQFEQLYGGAKRGGKSIGLCMKIALLSFCFPGNRGLLARMDFTDLQRTTLKEFFETVPDELIAEHNKSERRIEMKTCKPGVTSTVLYSGLGEAKEVEKVKGLNLGWLAIDEPSEIKKATYKMLRAQLTWILPGGKRPPYMAMMGSNPEPGWVKDDYIDKPCDGRHRVFIPSLPRDNPYLPPNWEADMRRDNDAEWVNKYLDGDWNIAEGTVFVSYNPEVHEVEAFDTTNLKLIGALDHAATGVVAFNAVGFDADGNMFVLKEYYQENRLISEHCTSILDDVIHEYAPPILVRGQRAQRFEYILIDPSTMQKTHQGKDGLQSIQSLYAENGINTIPAWNQLEAGLERIKERLHIKPNHRHPFTGEMGAPTLFFVRGQCRRTIKELRELRKVAKEDGSIKYVGSDHGLDTVRYIVNAQVRPPSIPSGYEVGYDAATQFARKTHEKWAAGFARSSGATNSNEWFNPAMYRRSKVGSR